MAEPAKTEAPKSPANAGNDALLSASGQLPSSRWRILETLFQRLCETAAERLSALAGAEVSVMLERLWSAPVQETGAGDGRYEVALCEVAGLPARGCIGFDRAAAGLVIEAFLGGGAAGRTPPDEARPFTSFDRALAKRAGEEITGALEEVFAPLLEISLTIGDLGAPAVVEDVDEGEKPVLAARLTLDALGETGSVLMLLPQAAFAGLRACALKNGGREDPAGEEKSGKWRARLGARVRSAQVSCSAMIDGGEITLADVARLRPGQVLELRARAENPVTLMCDGAPLYLCELGQANGMFTLRVGENVDEEKEFLNAVVKG